MQAPPQTTIRRPLSVTIIAWLFILAGSVGVAYHATDFRSKAPFDHASVCLVRVIAIIAGVYLLRGRNWARWVLVLWLAYHVLLAAFHTVGGVVMHVILLAVIGYFLFRANASAYFQKATPGNARMADTPAA